MYGYFPDFAGIDDFCFSKRYQTVFENYFLFTGVYDYFFYIIGNKQIG